MQPGELSASPFPEDDRNPYAPPRADLGRPAESLELEPTAPALGEILTRTWEIYRARMGLCLGVVLVFIALNVAAMIAFAIALSAAEAMAENGGGAEVIVAGVVVLGLIVFWAWITLGLLLAMLEIARGREGSIAMLFGAGPYLVPVALASLLFFLLMFGVLLIAASLGGGFSGLLSLAFKDRPEVSFGVAMLGATIAYIAMLIVSLRFSQYIYLILDRRAGVIDSLRLSFRITRGRVGLLFAISLLAGLINLAGMMTCGLGVFFTTPYLVLMFVVTYLALDGKPADGPDAKGEPLADLEPL